MLTRRQMNVFAGASAGLATSGLLDRNVVAALAPQSRVSFDVPRGACDCHVHVFPDPAQFPFTQNRVYTPSLATVDDLLELQRVLHLDRVILNPVSVYGTDSAALLDGLRRLGPVRARGLVAFDEKATPAQLDKLAAAGIRGMHVNLAIGGVVDPATSARRLGAAAEQAAGRGWHVQTQVGIGVMDVLKEVFMNLPVPLAIVHFGGAKAEAGVGQLGFASLLELVRSGKVHVKVSAAHSASSRAPNYPDVAPLAQALIEANPDRIVWGTNWPHPDSAGRRPAQELSPNLPIDDGAIFNELVRWAPDSAIRHKILVDNPARLYGFV